MLGVNGSQKTIYKVEQYNINSIRIIKLYKNSKENNNVVDYECNSNVTQEEISLSRTKRNIRRICLSNHFEYFATWTIDSKLTDRYSLTACVDKMKELLKAFQRKYNTFKYIYIIEKHKDGAFHFHGLVKGIPKDVFQQFKLGDKMSKQIAEKVSKGCKIYHIPFFDNKLGFNSFTEIQHYDKCCNYIIKYISNDCVRTTENQVYFCSRGLSKGQSYEVKYIPYELFDSQRSYTFYTDEDKKSPICVVRDLNIAELKQSDLLSFGYIQDMPRFLEVLREILKIKKVF